MSEKTAILQIYKGDLGRFGECIDYDRLRDGGYTLVETRDFLDAANFLDRNRDSLAGVIVKQALPGEIGLRPFGLSSIKTPNGTNAGPLFVAHVLRSLGVEGSKYGHSLKNVPAIVLHLGGTYERALQNIERPLIRNESGRGITSFMKLPDRDGSIDLQRKIFEEWFGRLS